MIFKKDQLLVKTHSSRNQMGESAAKDVALKIRELQKTKEIINMIFAAAPSQNEFLAALIKEKEIEWNRIQAFHMDEYIGLDKFAKQGFGNFLKERIFEKLPFKNVFYLDGQAQPEQECNRYSQLLIKYPADIVCLGIGENGHIAFNDPHVADFNDKEWVKVVDLDIACRQQQVNDGCFTTLEEVPTHAYTLTIPALTTPPYLFCVVPSATKAQAVYNTLNGKIEESCPASILRLQSNAILYIDLESATLLNIENSKLQAYEM